MNLNHINLPVADVALARDFFSKYFGMRTTFELPKNSLVIMKDEGGMILNLSHFDKKSEIAYHKDFHIGFFVENRETVDGVYASMLADGIVVEPPKQLQGRWSFYVDAPGGFQVEVGCVLEGASWAK
jgi:catechol 2,3-dioxygenase-like lactoylglutathione lyase family enzyme